MISMAKVPQRVLWVLFLSPRMAVRTSPKLEIRIFAFVAAQKADPRKPYLLKLEMLLAGLEVFTPLRDSSWNLECEE